MAVCIPSLESSQGVRIGSCSPAITLSDGTIWPTGAMQWPAANPYPHATYIAENISVVSYQAPPGVVTGWSTTLPGPAVGSTDWTVSCTVDFIAWAAPPPYTTVNVGDYAATVRMMLIDGVTYSSEFLFGASRGVLRYSNIRAVSSDLMLNNRFHVPPMTAEAGASITVSYTGPLTGIAMVVFYVTDMPAWHGLYDCFHVDMVTAYTGNDSPPEQGINSNASISVVGPEYECGSTNPVDCEGFPDFTAQCGDVFVVSDPAGGADQCFRVEDFRNGGLVGRALITDNSGSLDESQVGYSMAFDSQNNLYVPVISGLLAGTVQKLAPTGLVYSSNSATWFTPPVANEFPFNVRFDRDDTGYVVVLGGNSQYVLSTYAKLYKLDSSGVVVSSYELDLPAGNTAWVHFNGGVDVARDGTMFWYTANDTQGDPGSATIKRFDLTTGAQASDFAEEFYDSPTEFFPRGIALLPDGRVLVANQIEVSSLLRVYDSQTPGSSYIEYSNPISGTVQGAMEVISNGPDSWLLAMPNNGAQYVYEFRESTEEFLQVVAQADAGSGNMAIAVLCGRPASSIFVPSGTVVGAT